MRLSSAGVVANASSDRSAGGIDAHNTGGVVAAHNTDLVAAHNTGGLVDAHNAHWSVPAVFDDD